MADIKKERQVTNEQILTRVDTIRLALEPFRDWARCFDPEFNENLSEPIDGDFLLQNSLVPDGLTVMQLRELDRIGAILSDLRDGS